MAQPGRVSRAMSALAIRQVPFKSMDGNMQGYSVGQEFAINPVAVYPMKTRMHEIAHIALGHTTPEELAEYQLHRGHREFEAEGTAFLVVNELGQLNDDMARVSRGYVQGWLKDDRPTD